MRPYVLSFSEIEESMLLAVGGKGLNLGKLKKIEGINVPDGFCVTTEAYSKSTENNKELNTLLDRLMRLKIDDRDEIHITCKEIRALIENLELSKDIEDEIIKALSAYDEQQAFAVRSSATAEDLPNASFAGQQDTYLNIKGRDEILKAVLKCWASLFTERAVTYRIQNGFDHNRVFLSVVVQKMVMSEASGILFTADPMTSDRMTMSIDAGFGLGEVLVSGLVNPDIYKVREGKIVSKKIGSQRMGIRAAKGGGTQEVRTDTDKQRKQVLSDEYILSLYDIGRKIQKHFGAPQDIEWCLYNGRFYIVQSRPITTLFPPPENKDGVKRVYMSTGHMQMMTDTILPLGMSTFELASVFSLDKSGGRLFADITHDLATSSGRRMVLRKADGMDPLMASAVRKLLARKDYLKSLPKGKGNLTAGVNWFPWLKEGFRIYRKNDPSIFEGMIKRHEEGLIETEKSLDSLSGDAVSEFILNDKKKLHSVLYDDTAFGAILTCQFISAWLNKNIEKWLGEKNITSILSRSVEHNITSEMGLALCDVSDVVRQYPAVIDYFKNADDSSFFTDLEKLEGGIEVSSAIKFFLQKYGMRCPGEIDITKPRWHEKPTQLIPMIMSNVNLLSPGSHMEKFNQGKQEAEAKIEEILKRLMKLPGGARKARKAKKMISVFRNFVGAREYPKYFWICRNDIYKKALMREADKLVAEGIIDEREDVYYLYLDEFREAVRTKHVDRELIEQRRADYLHYEKLTPPRIIMSDGEVPSGEYGEGNIPEGALVGIPVSSGIIEGRARVVEKLEEASVEKGEILVTAFTDPSWTPIFISISGLVTEVGGMMSHGAVITREYGLPAVVGVENATKLIRDGQKIRVNGNEGYIEMLE